MTFLLIDTSGEYAVLALADETGKVEAASVFEGRRSLSRRLMGELDSLLGRNGKTLHDMTALVVGLGPGSFTGVRVGVTTMKTLAQVTGKPLIGIGTLDAYAAVWEEGDKETFFVPTLPSRRGEVYAAIYRGGERIEGPFAASIDAMPGRLKDLGTVVVCCAGAFLGETSRLTLPYVPPSGLARLAARRLASGDFDDPLALVPLYVVAPSISTPKERPVPSFSGTASSVL